MCASVCICLKEAAMQCFVLMLFINLVIIVLLFFSSLVFLRKKPRAKKPFCLYCGVCEVFFFFMHFLFSAFFPPSRFFVFMLFYFVFELFLTVWKKAQRTLKKSVQTMDTKQAKFVWADATKFFWILIPAGAPNWESNVLPAVPPSPHNVSSTGFLRGTGLLRSYMGASINTKKNIFFPVSRVTHKVHADVLWFVFPGSNQSKAKWKTEDFCPFIPSQQSQSFFGGVSVPVLCIKRFLSVPDSSHWTLCILRRAHSSLPLPVCAHLCLFTKQVFTFQKFKTFQLRRKTNHIF